MSPAMDKCQQCSGIKPADVAMAPPTWKFRDNYIKGFSLSILPRSLNTQICIKKSN